jgi:hypothetical protein
MLLSTREPNLFYNIIINSCIKRSEIFFNKKIRFYKIVNSKFPDFSLLLRMIFFIISGSIFFKKKRINLNYYNIEFGRFVTAQTYRDYRSYISKFFLFKNFIFNLFHAARIYKTSKYYLKKNFNILYVDHVGYLNGIIYTAFAEANKIIYTNNYPKSIYGINFKKKKNFIYKKYENSLKIYKDTRYQKKFAKSQNVLKDLIKGSSNVLPWMTNTNFIKFKKNKELQSFDYVVYVHSFTDAQLWFGLDGFENSYDWLEYTLTNLKKNNKKVIIKAHPNYYNTSFPKSVTYWDKKIFDLIYSKFKDYSGFFFLNYPIKNGDFVKNLKKKTICITHHGSVLIELAFLEFKIISSSANFFSEEFKVSNFWKNKKEYAELLNKNWNDLKKPNLKDIFHLTYKLFIQDDNYNGKNSYRKVIAKVLKKDFADLTNKDGLFQLSSNKNNNFKNNINQKQLQKIINILGKKITII